MEPVLKELRLLRYNIKIIAGINMVFAVILVIAGPFIFSYRYLNQEELAKIGEVYLSLIGIFLFPGISLSEKQACAEELILAKAVPYSITITLRICVSFVVSFISIFISALIAKSEHSIFDFRTIVFGVWVTAVYIGTIGFTVSNIFDSLAPGYFISFAYYAFELFTAGKYTKNLYLFGLMKENTGSKCILMSVCIILIGINIIYAHHREK